MDTKFIYLIVKMNLNRVEGKEFGVDGNLNSGAFPKYQKFTFD